jgi:hypothetical protein
MATDSFLSLACAGLIAFVFGLVLCFSGYRFFLILLPIWGFVFGLTFGAQTMQAIFGVGFLATITSWMVGFIFGAIFAVLSYLFYIAAVALIAASLGYAVAVGLLTAIGLPMGLIVWIIGLVAAVALALVVLRFNVQKWVIIIATSILGAGTIIATFVMLFNPAAEALQNPVQVALRTSPLLAILFLVLAVFAILAQYRANKNFEIEEYNRLSGTMNMAS